ncbi:MAG: T9SS type A sorting domain-containing protein [Bacteroidota bacterium]
MKKYLLSAIKILIISSAFSQNVYNKVGGLCFRVDDHQGAVKWRDYNRVFNKYGFKFSLGIDAQRFLTDTAGVNALKELVASGHELMDHTPSGTTAYIAFASNQKSDTLFFRGKKGVHHINNVQNRVCLSIDSLITGTTINEGLVDVYGNTVISQSNGEFKNFSSPISISNLYFPTLNLVCTFNTLQNKNQNDPDTVLINNYWQEAVKLDTLKGIPFHKLTNTDIKMTRDALKLLVERTQYVYESLGLPRPKTWIQPGGPCAQLNKQEVKELMGYEYGFTAGATYPNPSFKMYNEVDSLKNKRFALQNLDINDESNYFQSLINIVADNSAKHTNSFTLSHFFNPVGGWDAYLGRTDSLLAWCQTNNIPVRNTNKWASIMFDSTPNPYVNIIPELYTDLNFNGIPDGYTGPFATFDSTDGVARSRGKSMSRNSSGSFYSINLLGGAEKGWNRLSVYSKGSNPTDSLRISINFPELPVPAKYINLAANTQDWQEVTSMVYIDPRATRINFQVNALRNNSIGLVKISGVQLRKLSNIKIASNYKNSITTDKPFSAIELSKFVIDSAYSPLEFKAKVKNGNILSANIDSISGTLSIRKPSMFWVGMDSMMVSARNNDKTNDSAYIYLEITYPRICAGSKITLKSDATYGNNFKWIDGSNEVTADSVSYTPTQSSWYKVNYTNLNSELITDSIYVIVNTQKPSITFAKDTILCKNSNAVFTVSNTGTITWTDIDNNILANGPSYQINSAVADLKLYISNTINSCSVKDSVNVTIHPNKILTNNVISKLTTTGNSTTFDLVVPAYASITLLNTPFNTFSYQNGIVLFNPKSNFNGKDSALFLVSDGKCIFDSIWLKVSVGGSGIKQLESEQLMVYPNPAKGDVTIDITGKGSMSLYNLLGQLIMQLPLNNGKNIINFSSLNNGVYTIQIVANEKVLNHNLIKE